MIRHSRGHGAAWITALQPGDVQPEPTCGWSREIRVQGRHQQPDTQPCKCTSTSLFSQEDKQKLSVVLNGGRIKLVFCHNEPHRPCACDLTLTFYRQRCPVLNVGGAMNGFPRFVAPRYSPGFSPAPAPAPAVAYSNVQHPFMRYVVSPIFR